MFFLKQDGLHSVRGFSVVNFSGVRKILKRQIGESMALILKPNVLTRGWSFAAFFLFLGASLSQAQTITNSSLLNYSGNYTAGSATIP